MNVDGTHIETFDIVTPTLKTVRTTLRLHKSIVLVQITPPEKNLEMLKSENTQTSVMAFVVQSERITRNTTPHFVNAFQL